MIKGVIFDLDGVICFTDEYHYEAWKAIADEEGIYFDKIINNRLRGVSRMASLDIILERANKEYSQEEKNALAEKKNGIYRELLRKMNPDDVSSDTRNTIKELKARGIKVAIGSSSKNARFILTQIGLIDEFEAISDGTMIKHSKPDPEVFALAGKLLNIEPSEGLVVEDAIAGIESGHNGGFKTAAIGDATKSDLANYKIEKLSDILKIVE